MVVSDSVSRLLRGCPTGWEVKIYTGSHLYDIDRLLREIEYQTVQRLQQIIVYTGVNHSRDIDFDALRSQVQSIMGHGVTLHATIYFYLVPTPSTMDRSLRDKLAEINNVVRNVSGGYRRLNGLSAQWWST